MTPDMDPRFNEIIEVCRRAGKEAGLPGTMANSWTGDGFECSWAASLEQGTAVGEVTVCLPANLAHPGAGAIVSRLTRQTGDTLSWKSDLLFHPSVKPQVLGERLTAALTQAWETVIVASGKPDKANSAAARTSAVAELRALTKRHTSGQGSGTLPTGNW